MGQRGLVDLGVEGGGCRRGRVIGPSTVLGVEQAELVDQRGFGYQAELVDQGGFVGWTRQSG